MALENDVLLVTIFWLFPEVHGDVGTTCSFVTI